MFDREHPAHQHVARLHEVIRSKKETWLVYELGGRSLSKSMFDIRGEFFKSERIYYIEHLELYEEL